VIIQCERETVRSRVLSQASAGSLDRIDPYANVILSGADVTKLAEELKLLEPLAVSEPEKRQLTAVQKLIRACVAAGPDRRLHFIGD